MDTGGEPGQWAGSVGKRANPCGTIRIQRATADGPVTGRYVKHDVTVQRNVLVLSGKRIVRVCGKGSLRIENMRTRRNTGR